MAGIQPSSPGTVDVNTGDIQIGAVEIKNSTNDTRATVDVNGLLTGTSPLATKTVSVGSITYVCTAAPGTAQTTAAWQCKEIDETVGIVTTWADGNANFDNVATDPTALDYS